MVKFPKLLQNDSSKFRAYNQVFEDANKNIWAVALEDQAVLNLVRIKDERIIPVSEKFDEPDRKYF